MKKKILTKEKKKKSCAWISSQVVVALSTGRYNISAMPSYEENNYVYERFI